MSLGEERWKRNIKVTSREYAVIYKVGYCNNLRH